MSDRAKLKEKYVSNLLTYISFHNNHCLCYDVCFHDHDCWVHWVSDHPLLSYHTLDFFRKLLQAKKGCSNNLISKKIEESGDEVFIFEILSQRQGLI